MNTKRTEDPFEALDKIAEIGRMEGEVKLADDVVLIVSTLDAEEENQVFMNCSGYEGIGYIGKSKIETLAFAIKGINGKKFDYDKIENDDARLAERKKIVDKMRVKVSSWRDEVITHVYDKWLKLTGNSEEQLKKLGIVAAAATKEALDKIREDLESMEKEEKEES